MPTIARLAIAAAAVVALVLAWGYFRPSEGPVGGVAAPTPTPTASPTPQPLPISQALEPGRYRFDAIPPGATTPFLISITVPSGWTSYENFAVDKNYGPGAANAGASFVVWDITNRFVHPCTDHTLLDPAPGPGIDELIESLASQPGIEAGPPTDVTVDGYRGKSIELTVTTDIDTCTDGFWVWGDLGGEKFAQGTNEVERVYVLDVDGARRTFFARIPEMTTPADLAELEAIIEFNRDRSLTPRRDALPMSEPSRPGEHPEVDRKRLSMNHSIDPPTGRRDGHRASSRRNRSWPSPPSPRSPWSRPSPR